MAVGAIIPQGKAVDVDGIAGIVVKLDILSVSIKHRIGIGHKLADHQITGRLPQHPGAEQREQARDEPL